MRTVSEKTTAIWIMPILILTSLSGCALRESAVQTVVPNQNASREEPESTDWERVQAVLPDTKTAVEFRDYEGRSLDQETDGQFHSATDHALTLTFEDGLRTFPKAELERVLVYRPVSERWAGWATLAVSSIVVAYLLRGDTEGAPFVLLPFVAGPTALAFYGSASMKEIYRVKPRDLKSTE